MKCPHCQSEHVGHSIGMYFIAYECREESCKHQWIERFEVPENKEEADESSQR